MWLAKQALDLSFYVAACHNDRQVLNNYFEPCNTGSKVAVRAKSGVAQAVPAAPLLTALHRMSLVEA